MKELKLRQCRLDERYDVLDCLGRGSYSEIYSATDISVPRESPHRTVVIKALNVSLQGSSDADMDRTLLENFQNEAIALDRVRHPHIISRLGHGTAIDLDGTVFHYLVLEFLSGGDLAAICRQQPCSLDHTLFYLEQVCSGLAYAHERGVIHRDIKPQNLLLTADGQTVKIADFGVAKIEAGEGAITRVGTNVYAPPEHSPLSTTGTLDGIQGLGPARQLTPAADIYSLAKTVYTLLAGVSPRRFSHHEITELPPDLASHFWSPALLRVIRKATRDDPDRRYQTVQEFWDELSDAALPSTQELPVAEVSARESLSSQTLTEIRQLAAEAPPQVNFEPAVLARAAEPEAAPPRPRIVVEVADRAPLATPPVNGQSARPKVQEILRTMPDADAAAEHQAPRKLANTGFRRFLLGLILLALFAGMLAATYSYFRGHGLWPARQTGTNTAGTNQNDLVGREVTAVTDVNLRAGPGGGNSVVGTVESGSRVKVLAVSGDWLQVQVLQHGRTKDKPASADSGWMSRVYQNGKPTIILN